MKNEETTTRGQARKGDRPREGRLWESCEPMDKNRIEGRHGAMSWHNTAKSSGMPVEVNSAAVQRSNVQLPGEISPAQADEKSAEIIVIEETSRSAESHGKVAGETHPMKDRTNEEGVDPATDKPTENARRRGELESRGGKKHGTPQERTMIKDILEPDNVALAWKRVRSNKGAPGIDGMTVADFPAFSREHWPRFSEAIMEGRYRPAPVRRAWVPKPDGSKRPLGIPTVLDRVIQQAIAQILGPLFEVDFSEDCAVRTEQPLAGGTRCPRHESHLDRSSLRAGCPSLIGTALYGAVRRVVWDRGANHSPGPDSASLINQCKF